MVMSSSQGDVETRFGHLLQPIRDLAKNWDVDIATHLEEYLEEIEKVAISFDGGKTTMNFAEAALLIQGSASVYSKKVEYLYTLVYQVLDTLASKKKLQKAAAAEGEDPNQTVASKDKEEEFLSLDDVKEGKAIEKKSDNDDYNENMVLTVPQTPLALIPLDDGEKGENPLLSRKGELLGSRRDFKLNTSSLHGTGTVVIDLSHLSMLEISMASRPHSTPFPTRTIPRMDGLAADEANKAADVAQAMDQQADDGYKEMSFEDNNEDMPEIPVMDEDPLPAPGTEAEQKDRMQLRNRDKVIQFIAPTKPAVDPYEATLDPHEEATEKKFRKAKKIRLPAILETEATKKRKKKKVPTATLR